MHPIWLSLGHGVEISAALVESWTAQTPPTLDAKMRYLNACLTIVTLGDPDWSPERRAAAAETIAMVADTTVDIVRPILGLKFYGTRSATHDTTMMRCGAVTVEG